MGRQPVQIGDLQAAVDFAQYTDLSLPVHPSGVTAWGLDRALIYPHQSGDFTGSVSKGSPVNFNDIEFNPHAHGTHTESVGHIMPEAQPLLDHPPPPWMLARLVSVRPETGPGGAVVLPGMLPDDLSHHGTQALILRTHETTGGLAARNWSGSHPAYLHAETTARLAREGIGHLLVDLPSVDPEEDGGALAAHRAFWGLPGPPRLTATITELIRVPAQIQDGYYLLNLQLGAFANDACPSRPLIFPIIER